MPENIYPGVSLAIAPAVSFRFLFAGYLPEELIMLGKALDKILRYPRFYELHSSLVNRRKLAAIRKIRADFGGMKVLDLGCGPGTNAPLFRGADYTGLDLNEKYIARARKRFPGFKFEVKDVAGEKWGDGFDLILVNSFLHHVGDAAVENIFRQAVDSLKKGGLMILQEPLLPGRNEWYHRLLMNLDRGDCFRDLSHWKKLISDSGLVVESEDFYDLKIFGAKGFHMVSLVLRKDG